MPINIIYCISKHKEKILNKIRMNIFSKIRYYITEFFVGTFDAIWEYFFGSDQDKTKSKEFEASIILNERQEDTFLSKNNYFWALF